MLAASQLRSGLLRRTTARARFYGAQQRAQAGGRLVLGARVAKRAQQQVAQPARRRGREAHLRGCSEEGLSKGVVERGGQATPFRRA